MSYFVTDDQPTQDNKQAVKNRSGTKQTKETFDLQSVFNRFQRLSDDIDSIIGLPDVKRKLNEWNERQSVYWMRRKAGLKDTRFLPEIIILSGGGPQTMALNHLSQFCWKTGFQPKPYHTSYDVNKFVSYYVTDTEKMMQDCFSDNKSEMIDFYGFDQLVENPRPPVADWHDWVDIIINYILDNINAKSPDRPVSMAMSTKTYTLLKGRFSRFQNFSVEKIHCHYLTTDEMTQMCLKKLKSKKYIVSMKAEKSLFRLIEGLLKNRKDHKRADIGLQSIIVDEILKRQESRLYRSPKKELSVRKIRTINQHDIPRENFIADDQIVFY